MLILLAAAGWWDVLGLFALPALVALNGFFVAAEFALVAVRKTRVEELAARKVPGAVSVLDAVENLLAIGKLADLPSADGQTQVAVRHAEGHL